jgi:hypothetical protein
MRGDLLQIAGLHELYAKPRDNYNFEELVAPVSRLARRSDDVSVVMAAIQSLERVAGDNAAPVWFDSLAHPDARVARVAFEILVRRDSQTISFEPNADQTARRRAAEKWRQSWRPKGR